MRLLAAGICAGLLLTACGTEDDVPVAQPSDAPAGRTPDSGTDPVESRPLEPIGIGGVADSEAAGDGPPVVLTDVRLGSHPGFDRIVFELAGDGEAGWQVGYREAPRSQGGGEPVEVPGQAALGITLANIALPGDAASDVQPWSGPRRQVLDEGSLLDTLVADVLFEGYYTFFAGLDRERPFAVGTLDSPQRIVVDLLHEESPVSSALSQRCDHPAGFTFSYPEGWSVNSGETVPFCSRFAPDPFRVPPGTDARVGAITASVQAAAFDRMVSAQLPGMASRTDTTVDGRRAVRIERVSAGQGLYPAGVRMTSYLVDLEPADDGPRTLVVDTVGLPHFDYARNVGILDQMAQNLEIDGA